jgi:hypothetical protein
MTEVTDDQLALIAAGIQFCEVSARNKLNMAQTVDKFISILNTYYEDGEQEEPTSNTNVLKFQRKNT